METTLDPHRMIISTGVSGTISLLSFLIAEVGDIFIVPSPYCTAFHFDVAAVANNSLVKCPLLEQKTSKFRFSVEVFKKSYENALSEGLRPRAIIIVNPHNPTGDVYDKTIKHLIKHD